MNRDDIKAIMAPGGYEKLVDELTYMNYRMNRPFMEAHQMVGFFGNQSAELEARYQLEIAHTCRCGATIEEDETTCSPCRREANAEYESEIDRCFPRKEP